MRRSTALVVTLAAILVAIGGPLLAAIHIATREAEKAEISHTLDYARDVLNRSETISDQIDEGIRLLVAVASPDPCSARSIALMRRIDLASSYIQAMGHVVGNSIVCSSLGTEPGDLDIGPVDLVQPNGARLRTNVEFPFAKGATFIVLERDGFAAIIHKSLPLDTTTQVQGVSLALYSRPDLHVLAVRGTIKPDWIAALAGNDDAILVDDTHVVAIVASQRYPIAALAAEPATYVNQRARAMALILVPIGFVGALVLALAVVYLARAQLAMPAVIKAALRRNEFPLSISRSSSLRPGAGSAPRR